MKRSSTPRMLVLTSPFLIFAVQSSRAQECCDPEGPFALGEQYPRTPANCENIAHWADRAPNVEARISLAISGRITAVEFDGALAYLVMCEPPGMQVMCVTYATNGLEPGDTVLFGGGYARISETKVMLDPCLASRD
jgi:hypothetical protein